VRFLFMGKRKIPIDISDAVFAGLSATFRETDWVLAMVCITNHLRMQMEQRNISQSLLTGVGYAEVAIGLKKLFVKEECI